MMMTMMRIVTTWFKKINDNLALKATGLLSHPRDPRHFLPWQNQLPKIKNTNKLNTNKRSFFVIIIRP